MKVTKLEDLPQYFYKYRSLAGDQRKWTKSIIVDSELFWGSPLQFNDPFECAPIPEIAGNRVVREDRFRKLIFRERPNSSAAERRELLAQAMRVSAEDYEEGLRKNLPDLLKDFAVCSLSAREDSVLMWSHYADSHQGLCLRFRPLSRDSKAPHVPEKTYFEFAYPIIYSPERPVIPIPTLDQLEVFERTILTKADFWKYEEEWRLVTHENGPGVRPFPPECLDAVILGARMSDDDRRSVRQWAAERSAPLAVIEAKYDKRLFRLQFENPHSF